jgi:thioesterase domain-containing protein/aryl carrier-like protein
MRRLHLDCPQLTIVNGYGPTENTTFSLTHQLTAQDLRAGLPLPLGKPLRGRTAYVLDAHLQPVGPGVVGELWVGGAGVARGYLRQPTLTDERFLPDPFSQTPGARLYRTGDLARWRPDGLLDFLGRADNQIKLRGLRIELPEIEIALSHSPLVKQAVVLVKTSPEGSRQLVAYVVPTGDFDQGALVGYLKARLPDYMVPTLWVALPMMPLTLNGKLDTKALPEPSSPVPVGSDYLPPQTAVEQALASIWQQVLRQERVSLNSNFFDLGGDSILTIQVVSRARLAGYTVHPKDLFEHQSLGQLARVISERLVLTESGAAPTLRHSAMSAIQKEGNNIPFFALPGFLLYRYLGEHFSTDQPFYGFEPELSPYKEIDELAQHFIQEVKQVRPHGPYLLGAFCGDYPVVFEAAHALLAQGEQVPLIVLFEAFPSNALIPKQSLEYISRKLRYYYDEFSQLSPAGKLKYPFKELYNTWQLLRMKLTLKRKHHDYVPHTYPGNIVLVRATTSAPGITEDPLGGWAAHVTGKIGSVSVPGEHLTIFKNPYAAELAQKLAQVLAQAQGEVSSEAAK